MRYAAGVEYDGTGYSGWQRQHHARTIQGEVESALSTIANHPVQAVCAGRTDAGVHALGQVIHFDSEQERENKAWCFGANSLLPKGISLRWVQPVDDSFSARYTAMARRYRYLILDSRTRSGLFAQRLCWTRHPLDETRMQQAARHLVGEHDFSSFRASECQSLSPVRNVHSIRIERQTDVITLDIQANAFVHHMVRNIAGVLMQIGRGHREIDWTADLLNIKDRSRGGVTAPAHGLYFISVSYPDPYTFPPADLNVLRTSFEPLSSRAVC